MKTISINYNGKTIFFNYRDVLRNTSKVRKNVDLQVLNEMFNENVYRLTPDLLRGSGVVVDLGSHIGSFAIQAAELGAGRVVAVEANPENADILESNVLANNLENRISVIRTAVWSDQMELTFGDFDSDSRSSIANERESERSKEMIDYAPGKEFKVNAVRLDSLLDEYDLTDIDFMKCDIEWSEYFIFDAMDDDYMNRIKFIAIEFHGTDELTFGKLVSKLTRTHSVETLGSYERGGFIYARKY